MLNLKPLKNNNKQLMWGKKPVKFEKNFYFQDTRIGYEDYKTSLQLIITTANVVCKKFSALQYSFESHIQTYLKRNLLCLQWPTRSFISTPMRRNYKPKEVEP